MLAHVFVFPVHWNYLFSFSWFPFQQPLPKKKKKQEEQNMPVINNFGGTWGKGGVLSLGGFFLLKTALSA